ncbi:MAG TPA: AmmeMemoRadiSam system protein B [Candidatus Hydrogenedentes bacterium]|nr:AmmeMemoRadiSam system protein B [Candidatus Hydrogenedentota bacterium]HPG69415.1 AmmeMemoRadiSam system protein B [Candidatus Hydrogenedentota bacterium]
MALPALRNVDGTPVEHEGQTLICLFDPQGVVEDQLLLTPAAFFVSTCLDGVNDIVDIQAAFARQFQGTLLPSGDIRQIVDVLDTHGFLDSERFVRIRDEVARAFRAAPTREAHVAGKSYPSDPVDLRAFLDDMFTADGGPGAWQAESSSRAPAPCLVAPHIDFERGGAAYAHGYLGYARVGRPEMVLVFGVAHAGSETPLILTKKDFETPFGVLKTDVRAVERIEKACPWDPYVSELVHRTEHSIEFQAVMLAYLFGTDVRIVPILCGPFSEDAEADDPAAFDAVNEVLGACREVFESSEGASVIAGADLAHVGRRFGDPFEINEAVIGKVHRRDHEDLAHVTAVAPEAFYRSVMKDGNQRKVCGLGCIYAALKCVEGRARAGELVHYGYAHDPLGGIVSFAGVVFS